MDAPEPDRDYPVSLGPSHRVAESVDYANDKFSCDFTDAYLHTSAWPAWSYCPFCGDSLGDGMNTNAELPTTIPSAVAAFDDDTFKKICNELGDQGVLDRPNRTLELGLNVTAGELVRVTHVKEDNK
jgi:hypothetical protein